MLIFLSISWLKNCRNYACRHFQPLHHILQYYMFIVAAFAKTAMKMKAFSQNTVWLFCWLNYRDQLLLTQKLTKQLFTVTVTCYLATPAFNNQAINELRDLHKVQSLGSQVPYPRHISRIPSVHKTQPNIFFSSYQWFTLQNSPKFIYATEPFSNSPILPNPRLGLVG